MGETGESVIERSVMLIILISSVVVIAFVITGGCGDGGNGGSTNTPTPTIPGPTGFPEECDGTFDVDLSCPAESLAGAICNIYSCEILDKSGNEPEVVDAFTIVFANKCDDTDCFTLECSEISTPFEEIIADEARFIIDTIDDMPVAEDVEGEIEFGRPGGAIIIDGEEFDFECPVIVVP